MKITIIIVTAIILLLTACSKEYVAETPLQTESAVPVSCTDGASFVEDVTVPDETEFSPGKTFKKTWRIKNTGTCTWNEDYHLVFAMNNQMGAPEFISLKTTLPGEELDISVEMTAPSVKGSYRADFQLLDPHGLVIPVDNGNYLWTIITVDTP